MPNKCAAKNKQDEDPAFNAYLKKCSLEVENGFIKEVLPKLPRRLGLWMVSTIKQQQNMDDNLKLVIQKAKVMEVSDFNSSFNKSFGNCYVKIYLPNDS